MEYLKIIQSDKNYQNTNKQNVQKNTYYRVVVWIKSSKPHQFCETKVKSQ